MATWGHPIVPAIAAHSAGLPLPAFDTTSSALFPHDRIVARADENEKQARALAIVSFPYGRTRVRRHGPAAQGEEQEEVPRHAAQLSLSIAIAGP